MKAWGITSTFFKANDAAVHLYSFALRFCHETTMKILTVAHSKKSLAFIASHEIQRIMPHSLYKTLSGNYGRSCVQSEVSKQHVKHYTSASF